LDKNFAQYKNKLNMNCTGDWIFQIDADELPNSYLIEALPFILEANPDTEAYWIPRVNTVAGMTDAHVQKWGWRVDENNWVNFPDWQMRLYKNSDHIYWIKPVHEQLKGYTKFANLPAEQKYALYHPKNIGTCGLSFRFIIINEWNTEKFPDNTRITCNTYCCALCTLYIVH
jgi:hypothetical protein